MMTCPKCGAVQSPDKPTCIHMAGRKGGKRTVANRGIEFFKRIGQKGGRTTRATRGIEFFKSIGQKGGEAEKKTQSNP